MKKLLKIVFFLIVTVFMVSCGDKNKIPKQYLGNYELLSPSAEITEQGTVINNERPFCVGEASLKKKGDRYILKFERRPTQRAQESYQDYSEENRKGFLDRERDKLEANVKLKRIIGEKGEFREKYYVTFFDHKITGEKNEEPVSIWYEWNAGGTKISLEEENGRYILTTFGKRFIKID